MIAVETDTFKESRDPLIGIIILSSALSLQKGDSPSDSVPITIASGTVISVWSYLFEA
jgi:uncharacterized membrane protein